MKSIRKPNHHSVYQMRDEKGRFFGFKKYVQNQEDKTNQKTTKR